MIWLVTALLYASQAVALPESPSPMAQAGSEQQENISVHGQATAVTQAHGLFNSPYSGPKSFANVEELKTSFTGTLFLGVRLWRNSGFYFNPEVTAGSGLSDVSGLAAAPNGEMYRVDSPNPSFNIARVYLKQNLFFDGAQSWLESDKNQLAEFVRDRRLTLSVGKYSVSDFFDNNLYAHDPRTQFLNWALMDNPAWDYPADVRGYTWAITLELFYDNWALRAGTAMEPEVANGKELDGDLTHAHGDTIELEHKHRLGDHLGSVRLLAYWNHAHMGDYSAAIAAAPVSPDVTTTRAYRTKEGYGVNTDQEITEHFGSFLRAGFNDGQSESWAFTEADNSVSLGVTWRNSHEQPKHEVGLAYINDGLSPEHADYLARGGLGFLLGDGSLSYAREQVIEGFYQYHVGPLALAPDLQYVMNPGYNSDRGPILIGGLRLHYEN